MRYTIFILFSCFTLQHAFTQVPSKAQINARMEQMKKAIKDQITDLERKLASATDAETKKGLQAQITALKKQVEYMGTINSGISKMSDNTIQQASGAPPLVPQKDLARINSLPKNRLSEAEFLIHIKKVHAGVEKMIPVEEKNEALKIFRETKEKYESSKAVIANAANGCWMLGHWEKALFIMGLVCIDDITNADNLNNYASFLISTGGEQAAIPILEYLNFKYPNNSTIINNLGQAWFGLGDMEKAKMHLGQATTLYPNHSMSNTALSQIAQSEGDNARSIQYLKAAIKENYDPEKEGELNRLGYQLKFADLPSLNYPMKHDPFGLIPIVNSWPERIQANIDDVGAADAIKKYLKGIENFEKNLAEDGERLKEPAKERTYKLGTDEDYRRNFTEAHRSPAYILAERMNLLYCYEKGGFCFKNKNNYSPFIISMLFPSPKSPENIDKIMSLQEILEECKKIWMDTVLEPIKVLFEGFQRNTNPLHAAFDCREADQKLNAFLAKREQIYLNGVQLIKRFYVEKSYMLDAWIKMNLYSLMDDPPQNTEAETFLFVTKLGKVTIEREKYKNNSYAGLVAFYNLAQRYSDRYRSYCETSPTPDPDPVADDLEHFKVRNVDCEFVKQFITPIRYKFVLKCNTIKEETDPNLKKRTPDIQKGSVQNGNWIETTLGPLEVQHGPYPYEIFSEQEKQDPAPLSPENKSNSQCSLEYDKWGNLIGFNFQLNEDKTELKDPKSIVSGVDSRWSWNAIASPKKGYLNKLVIK